MARNLVLFCLDSVRKDYFDRFAPRLAESASVSFDACRAASSWSIPSHASMFTGELPHHHGVHTYDRSFESIDPVGTVPGRLPDHHTIGVSANVFASSEYGFDRFFDEFYEVSTGRRFPHGIDPNAFYLNTEAEGIGKYLAFLKTVAADDHPLASLANGILAGLNVASRDAPFPKPLDDGATVIERAITRALTPEKEPFFLFTNHGDVHTPLRPLLGYDSDLYSAPPDWSTDDADIWAVIDDPEGHTQYVEYFRELHGAAIDYLDRKLIPLIDRIRDRTEHETTFIITADHGENLGYDEEDGLIGHKSSLSEGVLHVPLLVVNPPDPHGWASNETEYISHLDLPELIYGLATGEAPVIRRDRVPAEVMGISAGPDPPADHEYWDRTLRCGYRGTEKWVWDSAGTCRRYEVRDTPSAQRFVAEEPEPPEWATGLFGADIQTSASAAYEARTEMDVDAATRDRLEKLGYL